MDNNNTDQEQNTNNNQPFVDQPLQNTPSTRNVVLNNVPAGVPPPAPVFKPASTTPEVNTAPNSNQVPAQGTSQEEVSDRRKVQIIGNLLIGFSLMAIVVNIYLLTIGDNNETVLNLVVGIVTALIGFGLKQYNKIAYIFFNVLSILSILAAVISVPFQLMALPFVLALFAVYPFITIVSLLSMVILWLQLALFIVGGILFHKKSIRQLFQ